MHPPPLTEATVLLKHWGAETACLWHTEGCLRPAPRPRAPHRSGTALHGTGGDTAASLRPSPPGPGHSSEAPGEGGMWTGSPKWHWVEYRFSGSKDCKQAPRKTVILPPKLVGLSMSEATTISLLIDLPSLAARSWNTSSRSKSGTWFFHGMIFFWTSVHSDWLSALPELEPGKEKENINLFIYMHIYTCVCIQR